MRAMGLALLITLVAFAGCLDGGDGDDSTPTDTATGSATPTETATETQTETDTGTSDPEPEENTPPTASLSASIQQGEVPVNVTFTLDGADADGDALNWTFDADGDGIFEAEGNGTGLPATYNHSYAANGTYNATLIVSDGKDSATQTVTINATAAAGGEGPDVVFTGTMITPDPSAQTHVFCLQAVFAIDAGMALPGGAAHELTTDSWGGSFLLTGDGIKVQIINYDATELLAEGQEGPIPEGATHANVCSETAVDQDYTVEIFHG